MGLPWGPRGAGEDSSSSAALSGPASLHTHRLPGPRRAVCTQERGDGVGQKADASQVRPV